MTIAMASRHPPQNLRQPNLPNLEGHLMEWVRKREEWKLPIVSGPTTRIKAMRIRDNMLQCNDQDDPRLLQTTKFSNGWLHRFQMHNNLKPRNVYGEAASVSATAVEEGRRQLHEITRSYNMRDIFNLDETAYFYCMAQSKTICTASIPGRKKIKKRITVAVTSNADGSSQWPLLFIGTSKKPRCLGGKSPSELDFEYTATKQGWMTGTVFSHWIERFNESMKRDGRRVLLLLDNASSHRYEHLLSNVVVQMLPPNTTAFLQPQDAGVIQALTQDWVSAGETYCRQL